MTVKDIMTTAVRACGPDTSAAEAAALMLDGDCGMLPVVEGGRLVGLVTDRDLYIALATRNMRASDLRVRDVARTNVWTCGPDDEVQAALATMTEHRVRRLPVTGFGDTVLGVLSLNDVLRATGVRKGVRSDEVVDVLRTICAHHEPTPHVVTA
jgi:CBS domain-containing protein